MGANEASPVDDLVAAYVRKCRDTWGGWDALGSALEPKLGHRPDPKTLFSWGAKNPASRHQPPARALIAMRQVTPTASLDAAADGRESVVELLHRYGDRLDSLERASDAMSELSRQLRELQGEEEGLPPERDSRAGLEEKKPTNRGV